MVKHKWLVFEHKGKELASISIKGLSLDEVKSTKELLAYEKKIPEKEIKLRFK